MSKSHTEELAKIGSIFSVYFLIQAYGYSIGIIGNSLGNAPNFTINEAIAFGFQHLSHFLRPWDKPAWPLTPMLGLPLLLYSLYLPQELRRMKKENDTRSLQLYLSFLFGVTFFPLLSGILGASLAAGLVHESWIASAGLQGILSAIYLISWIFWFSFAYKVLFKEVLIRKWLNFLKQSWPEILTGCSVGLILFAVYLGSEFDGAKDRLINENIPLPVESNKLRASPLNK